MVTDNEPTARVDAELPEVAQLLELAVREALIHSGLSDDPRAYSVPARASVKVQAILAGAGCITRQITRPEWKAPA